MMPLFKKRTLSAFSSRASIAPSDIVTSKTNSTKAYSISSPISSTHESGKEQLFTQEVPTPTPIKRQLPKQTGATLRLTAHEIRKLRSSWTRMLNDVFDESSDSSDDSHHSSQQPVYHDRASYVNSGAATSLFCTQLYQNLIFENPELISMFPTMSHQAAALSGVISMAIGMLENLSVLNDYLEKLGRRHSRLLNVERVHFEMMAAALVSTFETRFQEKFTYELEELWLRLFLFLSFKILENYAESYMLDENANPVPINNWDLANSSMSSDLETIQSVDSIRIKSKASSQSLNTVMTPESLLEKNPSTNGSSGSLASGKRNPMGKIHKFYKSKV